MRNTLVNNTITVIANEGLDRTTTKAISSAAGVNEAYIYRCFADKEDLLIATFDKLDEELFQATMAHIPIMYMPSMDFETRCRFYYAAVWRFLLGNREKCVSFMRYYYSQYFMKHSYEKHQQRYEPLVQEFQKAFRSEANTWMLLNHILNVMLDFAIKIFDGYLADDDDTAEHVFRLLYNSVSPYFVKYEEKIG